ncbi:hypothetical protein D9613_012852 [Agrocybe pediades]|uniref:Uncharacterized protein n=1 Tax=Agrocybe pediades TaxID=84607 RepID=A0A8H4QWB2_9AGAR|nr:hypothetical protein D9613_012852 [Agrocybe pediades]
MLHLYHQACAQLQRAISVCVAKIEEYVEKSCSTHIYALAMIINPIEKLKWIEAKWTHGQYKSAKEWILAPMLEYRKSMPG